jgi:hypothetical protein
MNNGIDQQVGGCWVARWQRQKRISIALVCLRRPRRSAPQDPRDAQREVARWSNKWWRADLWRVADFG